MEFNFPRLNVVVHSHDEAALKESVEACTLRPVEKKGDSTRALA